MLRQSLVGFVLKLGLGFSLLYAAFFSFLKPIEAIPFYPSFLATSIDDRGVVYVIGIATLGLVGWMFSGKRKFLSSLTVTVLIGLVALINITEISFFFKVAPSFAIALALTLRYYPRIRVITKSAMPGSHKKVSITELISEDESDIADDETDEETAPESPVDNSPQERDTK